MWLAAGLIALTLAISAIAVVKLRATKRAVARCRGWRPVRGQVVTCSIREVSIPSVGRQYLPVVEYRYSVEGKEYAGHALTMGGDVQYSRRRNAERRLAPYGAGQPVQVLVDPADPLHAVLECRAPLIPVLWMVLIGAWIVLLLGLGLLLTPGVDGPEPLLRLAPRTGQRPVIRSSSAV